MSKVQDTNPTEEQEMVEIDLEAQSGSDSKVQTAAVHSSSDVTETDEDETSPPVQVFDPSSDFHFFHQGRQVHSMVTGLNGYGIFLAKFLGLQLLRLAGAFSFLIVALLLKDDFDVDNLTGEQYAMFAVVGVLSIISRLIPMATGLLIEEIKTQLQVAQSTAVVDQLFKLEHGAVLATPTGEFAQLLSKVYMNLDKLLPAFYGHLVPVMIETFVGVIFIGVVYGWIALVQLGLIIIFTRAAYTMAERAAQRNKNMMAAMFSEWSKILDTANSYERAHFFDNVDHEVAKSRTAFEFMGSKIKIVSRGIHNSAAVMQAISLTLTGCFVMLLPTAVGDVEGIELFALMFYFFTFSTNLEDYAQGITELRSALFEYQTLNNFVAKRSEVADVEGAIELANTPNPEIEFDHVSFSYGGRLILDDVSFKVGGGQTLGLVGGSGCGKSTIMRLLLRFYRQSKGTITVDGHDITKVTGRSLRRLFSVVTQDSQLMNASIRDNICYGKRGSSDEEILHAATLAELPLAEHARSGSPLDKGLSDMKLDKICGEKGAMLSGGQQQRVSLARAMLKNGTIYLLDEPTTGLDGIVAKQLQKTLDALASHATTIMVTHHLQDLRKADQILYLENGKIVERGTYDSLCASKGVFYNQTQARMEDQGPAPGGASVVEAEEKLSEV